MTITLPPSLLASLRRDIKWCQKETDDTFRKAPSKSRNGQVNLKYKLRCLKHNVLATEVSVV